MAVMEFLNKNLLNTTSIISVDSSTATAQYLFNRNTELGYTSSGYNSTTSTIISVSFSAATILSHVLIQNHNLKDFSVYYNGTTTNSIFSATTNSATSSYIGFSSVTVSSIQLKMNNTISGGQEKRVGELVLTNRLLVFERNPTIADYNPMIFRKQIIHDMPDGGNIIFKIRDKFRTKLSWKYVTEDFINNLYDIFTGLNSFYFASKPTTTSWDGQAYEVLWVGDFDFRESGNAPDVGFSGSINLNQTTSG